MPGDPAPDFTLPIVNGSGDLSLSDLSGDPVVIAFFTAW
ncbi:MAG: redoxin domain-containing protein [Candidatus Marinimicrobia bacterium]|nr:redoxin domain-containing protein [Candidatus Neomarinimicrobiota bacterium]